MIYLVNKVVLCILVVAATVSCRIHKLHLSDDERRYVDLTTFGFFKGGVLDVKLVDFMMPSGPVYGEYGFTLDRTINAAISPYLAQSTSATCYLKETDTNILSPQHPAIVFLKMDFKNLRLNVTCKAKVLHLYENRSSIPDTIPTEEKCSYTMLPITKETRNGFDYYNTSFALYVATDQEEGLYNLYFNNCPNPDAGTTTAVNMIVEIYESNAGNFLSAGEMPLPALYSMMSLIFLTCAALWTFILRTSRQPVYRIHIIMCVLVYLKALSLAFHGINYHFIQTKGEHVTAWAILFYITHLLKGAVLFVTIVLVGTGWNFIKHILSDRDKKLFMIVIPLQVLANVAEIILAESEEGAAEHNAWRDIFVLVELLCCWAIMFPVVWSIRHLQDASSTDGKAAINLRKLKLFRHFYVMVVCYIYFTRIVISILNITVPFQYAWIDEMFREMATLAFFVMTGYKFRPAAANPYFTPTHVDDVEPQVLSDIGVLEGVTRIANRGDRKREDLQPLMQETNYNSD
ncbi:protein GPR107 [Spodoptera litura]|uniref:Protein GPR107 n=1 Tax=Spodoptera litura TaxID=69820 RepID=A0A9J7J1H5_SPOLT|nr:protein GPR107 [Spodoptera litura]